MHSISIGSIFFVACAAVVVLLAMENQTEATIRLHNITCIITDKDFAAFEICSIEVLNVNSAKIDVHVKMLQKGVYNDITVNFGVNKLEKSSRISLYNFTYDFCKIINRKKPVPFVGLFLDLFKENSNINHSCPYGEDIIVKDQIVKTTDMRYVPLPMGEYKFFVRLAVFKKWRGAVNIDFRNY